MCPPWLDIDLGVYSSSHNLTGLLLLFIGVGGRPSSHQSRTRKFEQDAKWNFCLTAGTISPRIRRDYEQTTAPEPHTGLQGEGGACRRQRRPDDSSTGRAL